MPPVSLKPRGAKCHCCSETLDEAFDTKLVRATGITIRQGQCRRCHARRQKKQSTPEFKKMQHDRYYSTEEQQTIKKNKQKTSEVRLKQKRYKHSLDRVAENEKHRIWAQTEEAKAKRRKRDAEPNSSAKQGKKRHRELVKANPVLRLHEAVQRRIYDALRGSKRQSATLVMNTEFKDNDDVVAHFTKRFKPGMRVWNYGQFWSIAHRIPAFWYDHTDSEDMARANSKENLGCDYVLLGCGDKTNSQKGVELPPDSEMHSQCSSSWPKGWKGKLPSSEYRAWKISTKHRKV